MGKMYIKMKFVWKVELFYCETTYWWISNNQIADSITLWFFCFYNHILRYFNLGQFLELLLFIFLLFFYVLYVCGDIFLCQAFFWLLHCIDIFINWVMLYLLVKSNNQIATWKTIFPCRHYQSLILLREGENWKLFALETVVVIFNHYMEKKNNSE